MYLEQHQNEPHSDIDYDVCLFAHVTVTQTTFMFLPKHHTSELATDIISD